MKSKKILFVGLTVLLARASGVHALDVNMVNSHPINLVVKTHLGAGFFAELSKVLTALIRYEEEGMQSVYVDWADEFFPYKDEIHENGWDLYFEPINTDDAKQAGAVNVVCQSSFHEIHDQVCSVQWIEYDKFLPYRKFLHEKITKYIRIKEEILSVVDDFYKKNMLGFPCIGVHVRFTKGHAREVPGGRLPTLEQYFAEVDALLYANPDADIKVYLASDSHQAMNAFKKRYGSRLLYIDAFRAIGTEDPHLIDENTQYWVSHPEEWHKKKPGFAGGVPVLYECLLLSRCDYLIHTTSNVANFVSFFNPEIKSIYLPRNAPCVRCRYKNDPSIKNKFLNPA